MEIGEVVHQYDNGGGLLLHLNSHGPSKWKWMPVHQVEVQSCCRRIIQTLSIFYFSKKFNKHQINYSTTENEALDLLLALQHFEVYIISRALILGVSWCDSLSCFEFGT